MLHLFDTQQLITKIKQVTIKVQTISLRVNICERELSKLTNHNEKESLLEGIFDDTNQKSHRFKTKLSIEEDLSEEIKQQKSKKQTKNMIIYSNKNTPKNIQSNNLNSQSFGLIKQAILINSNEIQSLNDTIQSICVFRQKYQLKVQKLEQGFKVMASVLEAMQKKIADISPPPEFDVPFKTPVTSKNQKVDTEKKYRKSSKEHKKFRTQQFIPVQHNSLNKYL